MGGGVVFLCAEVEEMDVVKRWRISWTVARA